MPAPFADFAPPLSPPTPLRAAITAATRRPEPEVVADLLARLPPDPALQARISATAQALVIALRAKASRGGVDALVQEYALSSQEGVALMCLAEALLRIPDNATRDALIRDKIAGGNWQAHVAADKGLFVNAATWGLMLTGKLAASFAEDGLGAALTRLIARAGEPVIRRGIDMAMRLMGEQFVTGETIAEALARSAPLAARGFAHSYDMLGEAATTMADADRYAADYEAAIAAIGAAAAGRGPVAGPGISVKLSALHPRYARAQTARVRAELLPRLTHLARLARAHDIGFNIDAEEADRLDLSLDLLEALAFDPALKGWDGLGFVVQAYGKRCLPVIEWLIDLARRSGHRLMLRLVKGAYWDSEIKRAQVDGLADFPVFTVKSHTDIAYLAAARALLAARDAVFPQFATHNAHTLASIYHMAGPDFVQGDYEFQCLHGMGEPLYDEVVGPDRLNRPCRIYAPVGGHDTLLAYLVRRLLENGANSSFVSRIRDPAISPAALAADPVAAVRAAAIPGAPHPLIRLPADLLGTRRAARGLDLACPAVLAGLAATLAQGSGIAPPAGASAAPVLNPADRRDVVGAMCWATPDDVAAAVRAAQAAAPGWAALPAADRAAVLERAADALEAGMEGLLALIIREAGKTAANAVAEVREAVDFLRYYAVQARATLDGQPPLGVVACISPWNFPLAIFIGQVAAALAAGNAVLAKPAAETPLIAAEAVRLLHAAGVPAGALHLLPGDGAVGAALVAQAGVAGVLFTGSTEVAQRIRRQLAPRALHDGTPVPLLAETGGLNAMIVDSSALAEQVTADVLVSAFDSAGQRCSALRLLCLQSDIADRQLAMIRGAMAELAVGNPGRLATDVGPVISAAAKARIEAHVARLAALGCPVHRLLLSPACAQGHFVAPTIIEIDAIDQIGGEVFGPVLHVLRFRREAMADVVAAINATGYGLSFGLHTRLDATIAAVTGAIRAGNLYVNRSIIGAVVGVQPFGGRGLSGTGPKAGGPLYLGRLVRARPADGLVAAGPPDAAALALADWLAATGRPAQAAAVRDAAAARLAGLSLTLPGPVGEENRLAFHPRGDVLLLPATQDGLFRQIGAALAQGNRGHVLWPAGPPAGLPAAVAARLHWLDHLPAHGAFGAALIEADDPGLRIAVAAMAGPIPIIGGADAAGGYRADWLVDEVTTTINLAAAGGNAALMAMV